MAIPPCTGRFPDPSGCTDGAALRTLRRAAGALDQGWTTDPFDPVEKDGRLYARGAADDKSGILQHAASIKALDGKLPVGIKILIEGEEETTSHLEAFVEANPDVVQCDVFLIDDLGNTRIGEPVAVDFRAR